MKTDDPKFKGLWEMTRDEFITNMEVRTRLTRESGSRIGLNNHVTSNEERWMMIRVDIVKQALKTNKPVPTEVLKDYPELKEFRS